MIMPSATEGQLYTSDIERPVVKNKWKCNVCGKIFVSLYILNYYLEKLVHVTLLRKEFIISQIY